MQIKVICTCGRERQGSLRTTRVDGDIELLIESVCPHCHGGISADPQFSWTKTLREIDSLEG